MARTHVAHDLFIGYTPHNTRVYVDIETETVVGSYRTVWHTEVSEVTRLSITGSEYTGKSGKRDSQMVSGGQITDAVRAVLAPGGRPANGITEDYITRLVHAWDRWHLNDMQAGCAHQTPVGESTSDRLDNTPSCPTSGYRWGSAWLVEELPTGLIESLTPGSDQ